MYTRKHYEELVNMPGKFEAEPAYSPYFYDIMLGGDFDTYINGGFVIGIGEVDRALFPELPDDCNHVYLYEDNQGFVYCHPVTDEEIKEETEWNI